MGVLEDICPKILKSYTKYHFFYPDIRLMRFFIDAYFLYSGEWSPIIRRFTVEKDLEQKETMVSGTIQLHMKDFNISVKQWPLKTTVFSIEDEKTKPFSLDKWYENDNQYNLLETIYKQWSSKSNNFAVHSEPSSIAEIINYCPPNISSLSKAQKKTLLEIFDLYTDLDGNEFVKYGEKFAAYDIKSLEAKMNTLQKLTNQIKKAGVMDNADILLHIGKKYIERLANEQWLTFDITDTELQPTMVIPHMHSLHLNHLTSSASEDSPPRYLCRYLKDESNYYIGVLYGRFGLFLTKPYDPEYDHPQDYSITCQKILQKHDNSSIIIPRTCFEQLSVRPLKLEYMPNDLTAYKEVFFTQVFIKDALVGQNWYEGIFTIKPYVESKSEWNNITDMCLTHLYNVKAK